MTVARKNIAVAIGILAAVILGAWHWTSDFRCSLDKRCAQLQAVKNAIQMYRLDTGKWPGSLDDLLSAHVPWWAGPYIPKEYLVDESGRRIEYSVETGTGVLRLAFPENP